MTEEEKERRRDLFHVCTSKEELSYWIISYLGLELPDSVVDPDSNCTPMEMVWFVYSKAIENDEEFSRVMFYAARDSFKTLGAAIVEVLAVLHLQRSVAHLAAILPQSEKAQSYLKEFFRRPWLRDFVVTDNGRQVIIARYVHLDTGDILTVDEFALLKEGEQIDYQPISNAFNEYQERSEYVKVLACTLAGVNSEHCSLFVEDELDVMTQTAVFQEAKSIPSPRNGRLPITMMISSRKFSFGLVQKEIDAAAETGLVVKHWNLIDVTERCPEKRHRPDLPKIPIYRSQDTLKAIGEANWKSLSPKEKEEFVRDEGYAGCLSNCKMFGACRGFLATKQLSTTPLLKPVAHTQNQFRGYAKNPDIAKAQLLCWEPSSTGLVYPRFDIGTHVLTPAQAYRKVFGEDPADLHMTKVQLILALATVEGYWASGVDFGSAHSTAWVDGFRYGLLMFVMHAFAAPDLDPDQTVEALTPFLPYSGTVWPDMSGPQMIKVLKKAGFATRKWNKGAGTVVEGIQIVQGKLRPVFGTDPELYIVHDVGEDPGIDQLIEATRVYAWKLDAGQKPTAVPDDKDDDYDDALRYLVMNEFPTKGAGASASLVEVVATPAGPGQPADHVPGQYTEQTWAQRRVAELTGNREALPQRGMTVENPDGSNYYAEDSVPKKAAKGKRGIIYDI